MKWTLKLICFFQCAFNALNLEDLANSDEDERTGQFVDMVIGVQDVQATMQTT